MSNPGIKIEISEGAVKCMAIGAVALGVIWLIVKLSEDDPDLISRIPAEAEEYMGLKAVTPSRLDEIQYDVGIVPKVRKLFDDGHYAEAVENACKHLFTIIRDVSGYLEQDGTLLIEVVFRQKNILKFKDTTEPHIRGVEGGYIEGLRYLAKSVRNFLAHEAKEMNAVDALTHINLACFFAYQVQHNTVCTFDAEGAKV